jgi:excisionase family DNA binding protein
VPRVFRKSYTRPIPDGAERTTLKGKKGEPVPAVRFKGPDGKPVVAPLTKKGDPCRLRSPTWYGRVPGDRKPVPLCANKVAAEQMLAGLVKEAELGKAGIKDDFKAHRNRPLLEHLADFEAELRVKPRGKRKRPPSADRVRRVVMRVRAVLDGCRFTLPGDIALAPVQELVHSLTADREVARLPPGKEWFTASEIATLTGTKAGTVRALVRRRRLPAEGTGGGRRYPRATAEALLGRSVRGLGAGTASYYAREMKAFTRWLVKRGRMPKDPLADLEGASTGSDHRHDRRPLSEDELCRVLAAALASPEVLHGLSGPDRHHLYLAAMGTGFRASEVASLTPERFDLAGEPPTVGLAGEADKSGRGAVQPLPPDVAEALAGYLQGKAPGEPVWPGPWPKEAAPMLRRDLEAAGIPYVVQGPDGPLFADFHALRHSYVAMLDRAGVSLKQAMQLARHSDPKLTMAVYGRAQLHDLGAAVGRLPQLRPAPRPQAMRATGTEGASGTKEAEKGSGACTPLAPASDGGRVRLMAVDGGEGEEDGPPTGRNPLQDKAVEAERGPLMAVDGECPDPELHRDRGLRSAWCYLLHHRDVPTRVGGAARQVRHARRAQVRPQPDGKPAPYRVGALPPGARGGRAPSTS